MQRRSLLIAATTGLAPTSVLATVPRQHFTDLDPPEIEASMYPTAFVDTPETLRRMIAVDANVARMYVLEQTAKQWKVVTTYPVGTGRNGIGKLREGDQRTPVGIYHIVGRHSGRKLGPVYGPGALVLDYPCDLDQREGRTGNDIWIHGNEGSSRPGYPPRSSSGCLVLDNTHAQALLDTLGNERTTVIIARQLQWADPSSRPPERRALHRRIGTWQAARSSADMSALWGHYAKSFANARESATLWRRGLEQELNMIGPRPRDVADLTILAWDDNIRVVTFTETLAGGRKGLRRRQYWSATEGEWRIFSEGVQE